MENKKNIQVLFGLLFLLIVLTHTYIEFIYTSSPDSFNPKSNPDSSDSHSKNIVERNHEDFVIVVLPDTQHYSDEYPEIFSNQTSWIVSQIQKKNIQFVIHEGDIVQKAVNELQWKNANKSISILEGKVPYSVVPGNHDHPSRLYQKYFPEKRYNNFDWYGGSYDNNKNNYQLISPSGIEMLVISLDVCPEKDELKWAESVLKKYPSRKAILVTHGYLNEKGIRKVHTCGSTSYIWNDLIVPNENIFLVLSGHVHAQAKRVDMVGGRQVFQLLADYQDEPKGGNGWLRIMTFQPAEGQIQVQTYSPFLDEFMKNPKANFNLSMSF